MRDFGTYVHMFVIKLTDCYIAVNKLYVQDRILPNHAIHVGIHIFLKVSFCEKDVSFLVCSAVTYLFQQVFTCANIHKRGTRHCLFSACR